ncbi:MAG: YggS family pyridoxal phosphate-dependent enzyme [Flavobacteriaceae bacterium]
MNFIKQNLEKIRAGLSNKIVLVAVSKTKPIQDLKDAYEAGQRVFGENKIQEMVTKYEALPKDIRWHMIGHLQRNKVKYMAHFVDLIHGVDSLKTLKEINKQALKNNRIINCLIQVRIAKEETKFGLSYEEVLNILNSDELKTFKNVKITGLMGMATFTKDETIIEKEFSKLNSFFESNQTKYNLETLSMGMSGDYKIGIRNGSTMIRVGSSIFGARNYIA